MIGDPRALGADSLTNSPGELWVLAEAFLCLRDESGDDKSVSVTLVYDSDVAKGLVTELWAPQSHFKLVSRLRGLYVEACDSTLIACVHVRSHGMETEPAKQHFLPLNEKPIALLRWVVLGNLVWFCNRWCRQIFLP